MEREEEKSQEMMQQGRERRGEKRRKGMGAGKGWMGGEQERVGGEGQKGGH